MISNKLDEIQAVDRVRIDEFSLPSVFGGFGVVRVVGTGVAGPVE